MLHIYYILRVAINQYNKIKIEKNLLPILTIQKTGVILDERLRKINQIKLEGGLAVPDMDYGKLLGRMKELGYTQKAVAESIGITESHFSRKISGEYAFKQSEIQAICELLGITATDIGAYFFNPKVEKNQPYEGRTT